MQALPQLYLTECVIGTVAPITQLHDLYRKKVRNHCNRFVDAEPPGDILLVVLGSSRPSSGTEGSVVITEHMLPAGHSR